MSLPYMQSRPPPSDQVAKRKSCHRYEIHGQTPLRCPTGRKLSTAKYLPEQHETWSISFPDNPKKKQCNKYVNCHFHVFIDKNATTKKVEQTNRQAIFSFISPYTIPPEKSFKSFSPPANPLQEGVPAEGSHREKVSGRGRILQLHQPVHIAILGMNTLYP